VKALLEWALYCQGERVLPPADHLTDNGRLVVDRKKYLAYFEGIEFQLPKKEFDLLVLLTFSPSRVFTRDEIYNRIRVDDVFVGDRTIDVYVRNLREKFGQHAIRTIKGVGYCYEA